MLLIDNDALIKVSAWDLVDKSLELLSESVTTCRRLASLPFIIRKRKGSLLKALSDEEIGKLLDHVSTIPEFDEDIDVEVVNQLLAIDGIDPGEAALVAGLLSQCESTLLTGDKKALSALVNHAAESLLVSIKGRIHCLESLVLSLIAQFGYMDLILHVRRNAKIDKTISICAGPECDASEESFREGLMSFVRGFEGHILLKGSNDCRTGS